MDKQALEAQGFEALRSRRNMLNVRTKMGIDDLTAPSSASTLGELDW